jgi:hypothetical protein
MPGSIHRFEVQSDVKGGRYEGGRQGSNVSVRWQGGTLATAQALRNAHCNALDSNRRKAEVDRLAVTIMSRQAKFDLNTILAVLGIIFSSGIIVEFLRRTSRPRPPSRKRARKQP